MNGGNKPHFLKNTVLLYAFTTFFSSEVSRYMFAVGTRNVSKSWESLLLIPELCVYTT